MIKLCQPRLQDLVSGWGGFGNTGVVIGQDGWLFYRPGVDSVIGPGFLDPERLRRRSRNWRDAAALNPIHADPRPAILQFKQQVEAAGACLILMPIPDKSSLQGDKLSRRIEPFAPVLNLSYRQFLDDMHAAGVEVFDPSPTLIRPGEIRYLSQDTHWTPQWMDEVARHLAQRVRSHLEGGLPQPLRLEETTVSSLGDLAEMLRLTGQQTLFVPQTVTIQRVLDADGKALKKDLQSPVLLLGDSFTNIYSRPEMGYGEAPVWPSTWRITSVSQSTGSPVTMLAPTLLGRLWPHNPPKGKIDCLAKRWSSGNLLLASWRWEIGDHSEIFAYGPWLPRSHPR